MKVSVIKAINKNKYEYEHKSIVDNIHSILHHSTSIKQKENQQQT